METIVELTDSQKLQQYIKTIPNGIFRESLSNLANGCKVSVSTFSNWRYGNCKIPELAKDKIEEIAGVKIFSNEN